MLSEEIDKEKKALKRLSELVVINTVGAKNARDLTEGAVIATFGLLLCFFGVLASVAAGARISAAVLKLGFLGYLAVLLYHYISIRKLRLEATQNGGKKAAETVLFASRVLAVALLLAVIDVGIGLSRMLKDASAVSGASGNFLAALPALVVIGFPLFFWHKLCEYTLVDEFVRRKLDE